MDFTIPYGRVRNKEDNLGRGKVILCQNHVLNETKHWLEQNRSTWKQVLYSKSQHELYFLCIIYTKLRIHNICSIQKRPSLSVSNRSQRQKQAIDCSRGSTVALEWCLCRRTLTCWWNAKQVPIFWDSAHKQPLRAKALWGHAPNDRWKVTHNSFLPKWDRHNLPISIFLSTH